ncbi:RNA polymerase, sigma subunit, ECF family [Anaerovirgula multivorans]|uniref:RNA polymerase, sigma subunit, ECF family n=1 Tax=Anaerovirgula multivorans TaxID=312168 RepID=A0A239K6J0_9FIRM|nr:RNA polymerase sigma factor [Anaerovirgula multivorans]SNT13977.1 RNA polymerase, sigma subunit, ECF family [Anaerovirgula multivorans]
MTDLVKMLSEKSNTQLETIEDVQHILYKLYYKEVFKTAYYIIKDKELAKDLVNEAYIKAYEKIDTLNDANKFKQWVCVIAANLAKNHIRKHSKIVQIDHEYMEVINASSENPEDIVFNEMAVAETKEQVKKAIERLNADYKEVIILRYYHNFSYQEISQFLLLKEGTVKTRLRRAKGQLYKLLKKEGEENV